MQYHKEELMHVNQTEMLTMWSISDIFKMYTKYKQQYSVLETHMPFIDLNVHMWPWHRDLCNPLASC